ncbi:OmpA family protein [Acrocarpospora corrugata]|uniref:OmpA family protein n=1 Tax=Acrocarpospora corrugata TaxID=35763 RepID=UPI00147809E1|nr:OmpA family protein [Acrocarpospora corrugata]
MLTRDHDVAPISRTELLWIAEKTDRVQGGIPQYVRDRVTEIAKAGDGGLEVYAVGRAAAPVGRISLEVLRQGERERDVFLRDQEIGRRTSALTKSVAATPVGTAGFDLYAALRVAEDGSRAGRREVVLATSVMSASVVPLDLPRLTATDPEKAVEEVMKTAIAKIDLSGVDLQPVLLNATGPGQKPMSVADDAWREEFITHLGKALGAHVNQPIIDSTIAPPWPGSSAVVEFATVKARLTPPDRIDAGHFRPDEATLLDRAAVQRSIKLIVAQYNQAPVGSLVHVTGFCARFGTREGARELARRRAEVIADLLVEAGLPQQLIRATASAGTVPRTWSNPSRIRRSGSSSSRSSYRAEGAREHESRPIGTGHPHEPLP